MKQAISRLSLSLVTLLLTGACTFLNGQTFYKTFGSSILDEGGQCVTPSGDGNLLVGGYNHTGAIVTKFDPAGNVIWIKNLFPDTDGINNIHQLAVSPDNSIVGIGNSYSSTLLNYGNGFIFKMDPLGNLIWIRHINDAVRVRFESVHADYNNQYLAFVEYYDMNTASYPDPMAVVFDAANGNVLSSTPRYNYIPLNPYIDDLCATVANSGHTRIYGTGRIYINGSPANTMRPHLTKYDYNGNLLSAAYLCFNSSANVRIYGSDITYNNDSLAICYFGDINGASADFSIGLIRTDTNGNIAWSRDYNITASFSEQSYRVLSHSAGYYILGFTTGGAGDFFIMSIDLDGNLLWSKGYGGPGSAESIHNLYTPMATIFNSHIVFTGRSINNNSSDLMLCAADFQGNVSCYTPDTLAITQLVNPTVTTAMSPDTIPVSLTFLSPTITPVPIPLSDLCSANLLDLGADTAICDSFLLSAAIPGATYLWQDGSTSPNYLVTITGTYWVTAEINCCIYYDTIFVLWSVQPEASFITSTESCDRVVQVNSTSTYATNYSWNFGDNSNSTQQNTTHQYATNGNYTVTLMVSNICGSDTATEVVTIDPGTSDVQPINVFTPNGDQINDVFSVVSGVSSIYALDIYDRWGTQVFHSDDPGTGWNGTYNGASCTTGVYYWFTTYTDCTGKEMRLHGIVELLR